MNFNNFSIPATNLRIFNAQKPLSLYSVPLNTKRISAFQHPCRYAFVAATFVAGSLLSPNAQAALSCKTQPSCSELGYTQNIDAKCPQEHILYCPFDTSYKKCILPSCTKLGFTTSNKSAWCDDIISCPIDTTYTACVQVIENPCPTGYDKNLKSVADCGTTGANGWTYESQTVPTLTGGTAVCGKCLPKSCSGSTAKKSVSDCGTSGSKGWIFSSCYYGDEFRGTCSAQSCNRSCPQVWKEVSQYVGDSLMTCYQCATCKTQGGLDACTNTSGCKWACPDSGTRPSGYDKGSCPANSSWYCCSTSSSKPSWASNPWQCR